MNSRIIKQLLFACIPFAAVSVALLAPYEIVNSISLNTNPNQSHSASKFDFYEDEFTGDSVPVLDNTDVIYQQP
ncbi:MAG: hypothetical protein M3O68_08785 [Thermoproteota archaeon]|nr:hypothetical protein [Thermoproteota archaeon]